MYRIPSNELKHLVYWPWGWKAKGRWCGRNAGEANEVRSGMGRIKAGGQKEGSVLLACILWKFVLWFLAEVNIRKAGCRCLWLAVICGVTVKYHTQTHFSSFLHLYFLCLWASLFVFSSEVCHWRDKQCFTEEEALETQKLETENSSVKDQLAHCAW